MATKPMRSLRGSIDDVLGDLLGYDDESPDKSARAPHPATGSSGRVRGSNSLASKKSLLEDDFFSKLPAEDSEAAEGSSASDADPQDLLQTLKDMDDMEADLLRISKPSSAPGKTTVKGPGKWDALGEGGAKATGKLLAPEKDGSLAKLLTTEEQDAPKKPIPTGTKSSFEKNPEESKGKGPNPLQTPLHTVATARRREQLTFEDDGDDLMDALGFGNDPKGHEKQGKKAEEDVLQPACSKLDKLLGRGSMGKTLEQPGMGEHKEFQLDKKYQKQPEKEEDWDKEDFIFGAYQPSVASVPKSQLTRRQSVRFSNNSSSEVKQELHSKALPAASSSPVRGRRAGGDWLGLKDEDVMDSEPLSAVKGSPAVSCPSPAPAIRPGPASHIPAAEEAAAKAAPLEEENWLSAALARKKAQAQAKTQERNAKASEAPGERLHLHPAVSHPAASTGAPQQAAALQDTATADSSGQPVPWLSTKKRASAPPSEAAKEDPCRDTSALASTAMFPGEQDMQGPVPLAQVPTPRTQLQAAPQLQAESPGLSLLHDRRLGHGTAQLCEDTSGCQAALVSAQARVAELESQVRTLELERTQQRLLLESLQQQRQKDLDLLESTYRCQMKVLEESHGQREERLRQELEQLRAQLLSQSRDMEQARAELRAQHQQHVAALEQQHTLEVKRLQELQRTSIQELRQDHDEQLQRLQRLKDQEMEAVTSATSHTRSLHSIVERMEKFSSDLHELSHKVEARHHSTSQELATGAQQLKVLQDTMLQQQKDMEEERRGLQDLIAKMEARLSEQTRQLEQERWKATAEQCKVESLQRSLEEQRRVLSQQLSVERAELERAKSALLAEQQSVMQKCSEERQKLAAEWAELRAQQQLSKEQMERDMGRALQMGSQREGTIISLAKELAELKFRGHELKAKEEELAKARELQDEAWQELKLEKEKVKVAAQRVQRQEEEVQSKAKLSSQKYEEGERALQKACRVEGEHQSRLQAMQQHLEQLRQQEEHLHQVRLSMAQQRRQLEQLREELPNNPMMLLTADQDLRAPVNGLSSTLFPLMAVAPHSRALVAEPPAPVRVLPQHSPGAGRGTPATASPTELCATLLLLNLRAQQDHDFLENEQFFLETLKKASYNPSTRSG
ncbi:fas-binding factor 1 isoform X2 [Colius striatus]|uniref:fas-binding factor 1 isoform X2 n=1 Tax=Colius striatus TaxID=57412 RepID=UPI002B1DC5CE|nr:fas-binding factor 1 isoform X2 [Colius striatus]